MIKGPFEHHASKRTTLLTTPVFSDASGRFGLLQFDQMDS